MTNFVKGLIPILFVEDKFKFAAKKIVLISVLFISSIALLELLSDSFSFQNTITSKLSFVGDEKTRGSLLSRITDLFFIAPILFLGVVEEPIQLLISGKSESFFVINMDFVSHWLQYLYAIVIYGLVAWSIILNRRNKFVWLVLSIYLIDVVIHLVIGYGLKDPFIYGGHWVYILPLLLGWLYKAVKVKVKKNLCYLYIGLVLICIINNIHQLYNFIELSVKLFPVQI